MTKYLYNKIVLLFLISFAVFISKWIFSLYYFDDSIDSKIIFDTEGDGYFYYYYTKYISELSFLDFLSTKDTFPIDAHPFTSFLLHAFLLKIFGFYGFLLAEFICIFLFLFIFYKICRILKFSNFFCLSIPLLIFSIPIIIGNSFLNDITLLRNFQQIYNLRYPYPLVSNLFLFSFIYFLLKMDKDYDLNFKNITILSLILSITFCSFFYYFVAEIITIFIFIVYKEKSRFFSDSVKKIRLLSIFCFIFLIISSPFIFMLINAEPDYMERLGTMIINENQKKLLLNHFSTKVFSLKFFIIFSLNILITIILTIKKSNYTKFKIVLDLFFISTIISPFLFIQFSPKISQLYHFNHTIFIGLFLSIFFGFCFLVRDSFKKIFFIKFNLFFNLFLIFGLLFINFGSRYIEYSSLNLNENYKQFRKNFTLVTNEIKKKKRFDNLITFNDRLMVWAVLHDFKKIPVMSGVLTPVSHKTLENSLFETFKLLELDENNFLDIFRNKKNSWRFINRYTQIFFWLRYSANSLTIHNKSTDFDKEDIEFIKKISPLHSQSIAIPNSELSRLKNNFIDFKIDSNNDSNYIVIFDKEMISMIKKSFNNECYIENNENLFFLALSNKNCL
jgi:hypothetical protein